MAYTVKKLAEVSGVSVRTLHFYDEIGLLAPAYVGDNGYRYYEEEQLLMLQQILFFREMGFELKQIQDVLSQNDFDKLQALRTHKEVLLGKQQRLQELMHTIDKTIEQLNGGKKMKAQEMHEGFDPQKQAEYDAYLVNRFGDPVREIMAESKKNTSGWSKSTWAKSNQEWDSICKDLAKLMKAGQNVSSKPVQAVIKRHLDWLTAYWTPNHDSYMGLASCYTGLEWKQSFEPYDTEHPKLACYFEEAMKIFADRELK